MRCAARQIETADIRAAIAGLKRSEKMTMACQTVDRAMEYMIAAIDVGRRKRVFANDPGFEVPQSRGAL